MSKSFFQEYSCKDSSLQDSEIDLTYNETFKNLKLLGQEECLTSFINIFDHLKRDLVYVKNLVIPLSKETTQAIIEEGIKEFNEIHSFRIRG
mmetsp:Transcript_16500/g.14405  ORF Transcript_16500/g.14405 Transcript_16500/m.14405 type:complete len:92 (-) Transcript_16500:922-1197(-)